MTVQRGHCHCPGDDCVDAEGDAVRFGVDGIFVGAAGEADLDRLGAAGGGVFDGVAGGGCRLGVAGGGIFDEVAGDASRLDALAAKGLRAVAMDVASADEPSYLTKGSRTGVRSFAFPRRTLALYASALAAASSASWSVFGPFFIIQFLAVSLA